MKRRLLIFPLLLASILLTAYTPMASFSMAQSVTDAKLKEIKQKAVTELDRRISNYQDTLDSMKNDVQLSDPSTADNGSSDKESGSITCVKSDTGTAGTKSPSPTSSISSLVDKDGMSSTVGLPCGLKDKVKQFLQKMVEQLKSLKSKVEQTTSLTKMQGLAQNIDAQFGLNRVTQVQALVTQAIGSMTGVLDKLKAAFANIKSQISAIKECSRRQAKSQTSSMTSASDGTITVTASQCAKVNANGEDVADQAKLQLDGLATIISTVGSILMSAIALLATLVSSFASILGGLGSLGSLGNLGNLSNLMGGAGGSSGLSSLLGSAGSVSGLLGSFTGILSQLNITQFMSGNLLSGLGDISGLLSGLNLPF